MYAIAHKYLDSLQEICGSSDILAKCIYRSMAAAAIFVESADIKSELSVSVVNLFPLICDLKWENSVPYEV